MSDALDSLTGLIIPLVGQPLLLPNVAVAELVGYRVGQTAPRGPEWFIGWASWRDQKVPLVDPGLLMGQPPTEGPGTRILILNAAGGRPGLNFIALRIGGIPRSRRVLRRELAATGQTGDFVSQQVQLLDEEQPLLIPDLEAIEQVVTEVLATQ